MRSAVGISRLQAGEDVNNQLYTNCLGRLWVTEYRIRSLAPLSSEDAILKLQKTVDFRSALHLSRGRVIDLLRAEDQA